MQHPHHGRGRQPIRTLTAYALVVLGPAVAWLTWVSWADGKPSDPAHVAWFVSVVLACAGAGALVPHRPGHRATLGAVAPVVTLVTLFLWWSAEDDSGLFVIGLVLAAPPVAVAGPVLVLGGAALGRYAARDHPAEPVDGAGRPPRPRSSRPSR